MDQVFNFTINNILAITAGISVSVTLAALVRAYFDVKNKLETLRDVEFGNVLESTDIKKLGNYLENVIGSLTVKQYSANKSVEKKVNMYLGKIIDYLGTRENIDKMHAQHRKPKQLKMKVADVIENDEFRRVKSDLEKGEVWNALARMRRYVEIKLKELARRDNIDIEGKFSLYQLIKALESSKSIDLTTSRSLQYAVTVASKAIHGEEIPENTGSEAVKIAANALSQILKKL